MNRQAKLQGLLDQISDPDEPLVIEYTDGRKETLPTMRQMILDQMELEDMFDQFVANGGLS